MTRLVMKFGGTSLGDMERLDRAARHVAHAVEHGCAVVVVVSAMGQETDRLSALTEQARPNAARQAPAEFDVVVASGEQVSAGLMALRLGQLGLAARTWLGWQIPVQTSGDHGRARISALEPAAVAAAIDGGEVAVVPGFQGISSDGRLTTLGRGGSDLTAVALAAMLDARCDVYTDVEGVFTTDPRIEQSARRRDQISYEEMLEMASLGASVLQTRSVELAKARDVPVRVLSSLKEPGEPNPGTLVCGEDAIMEKHIVSGVAYSRDEARVTLFALPDRPDAIASVFKRLADAEVEVDMIVRARAGAAAANLSFTVARRDLARSVALIEEGKGELGFDRLESLEGLSKISAVGVGMRAHADAAHTMFAALAERGVGIDAISTSEIKISVLIPIDHTEVAVRALHAAYGLDNV